MAIFLLLDTSAEKTSVSLALNEDKIFTLTEELPNSHSKKITLLIHQILTENHIRLDQIEAIAITKGPGSYTGLRIGSSTAKGLCFALEIPLIGIDTLESMYYGIRKTNFFQLKVRQFCSVLDAKRMEVYLAIFDRNKNVLFSTRALILDEKFETQVLDNKTLFYGSGAKKIQALWGNHPNAYFVDDFYPSSGFLFEPTQTAFSIKKFENLIDFEPFYLKEFFSSNC